MNTHFHELSQISHSFPAVYIVPMSAKYSFLMPWNQVNHCNWDIDSCYIWSNLPYKYIFFRYNHRHHHHFMTVIIIFVFSFSSTFLLYLLLLVFVLLFVLLMYHRPVVFVIIIVILIIIIKGDTNFRLFHKSKRLSIKAYTAKRINFFFPLSFEMRKE